ncbi:MAG: hypothetical protein WDO72_05430 [Pseudomonadota bacterium]
MGGRRASSISEIVGSNPRLAPLSRKLGKALTSEDPEKVARAAADLVATGSKSTDILYYATQMSEFIRRTVESGKDLSHNERESLAREEWSRVKAREGLPDDSIATQAIVSAATRAIARKKK